MYKSMYNRAGEGMWHRRRSVDHVMAELREARDKYEYETVIFYDEIFIDNRDWLEDFCAQYERDIGVPFWCFANADYVDTEVVRMMEDAGCAEVFMGVETVRGETRRKYLTRGGKDGKLEEAIRLFRSSSIFLSTGNMVGVPGQSVEEVLELAGFYNDHRVDMPSVQYFTYFPRTRIVDIAVREGLLTQADVEVIEEARDGQSFYLNEDRDGQDLARIRALIQMTTWAPRRLVRALIQRGGWRRIPVWEGLHMFLAIVSYAHKPWDRKRHIAHLYTPVSYIRLMWHYARVKLQWLRQRRGVRQKGVLRAAK